MRVGPVEQSDEGSAPNPLEPSMHPVRHLRIPISVVSVLLASLSLVACGGGSGSEPITTVEPPPPPPPPPTPVKAMLPDYCENEPPNAVLPQDHTYQVVLRNYLGCFEEADFVQPLNPVTYEAADLPTPDDAYRLSLLFGGRAAETPTGRGLRHAPQHFTLSAIEAGGTVNMRVRNIEPHVMAWWAQWDYAGNPHRESLALKARAFVVAAVDMMMLDAKHDRSGGTRRSDFLGGSIIRHAYTFAVVKNELPSVVAEAYEIGLRRMFDKLETWGSSVCPRRHGYALAGRHGAHGECAGRPGSHCPGDKLRGGGDLRQALRRGGLRRPRQGVRRDLQRNLAPEHRMGRGSDRLGVPRGPADGDEQPQGEPDAPGARRQLLRPLPLHDIHGWRLSARPGWRLLP